MSSAAVFQVNEFSPKSFAVSHDLIPDIAVLDPTLLLSVPKSTKIYSGLDALSHAVEGYASLFSNKYTQDLSELSIRICLLYTSPSPRDYAASRMPSSA